jgi:hypothetical protein
MTQKFSTIALIAAEIAHMKSTIDEAEACAAAKGRDAIGPLGNVDDYVARQRDLEELLSFYRPQSAADAAILASLVCERAAIVRHDYAAAAGFDRAAAEIDRLAAALAGWHGAPPADAAASESAGLVASLAADLGKAWALMDAADNAARGELPAAIDRARVQANLLRASEMIHAIESGIAAARVRTDYDAKAAATLLYAEADATVEGRARMLALGLAAYFGDAGAAEIEELSKRYGPRAVAAAVTTRATEGETAAVH